MCVHLIFFLEKTNKQTKNRMIARGGIGKLDSLAGSSTPVRSYIYTPRVERRCGKGNRV